MTGPLMAVEILERWPKRTFFFAASLNCSENCEYLKMYSFVGSWPRYPRLHWVAEAVRPAHREQLRRPHLRDALQARRQAQERLQGCQVQKTWKNILIQNYNLKNKKYELYDFITHTISLSLREGVKTGGWGVNPQSAKKSPYFVSFINLDNQLKINLKSKWVDIIYFRLLLN